MVDRKLHYLGQFNTKEEAVKARENAEKEFGIVFTGKHK